MRVLFIFGGTIWVHTLPEGFKQIGHDVRMTGHITKEKLMSIISEFRPDFAVSLGWGAEQTAECQALIHKCTKEVKLPHVYWSIEDPAFTDVFSIPLIKNMKPDFVFSQSAATAERFKSMGIKAAHMDFGYAPTVHHYFPDQRYKSSIAVVANAYPDILGKYPDHYRHRSIEILIRPLLKENLRIDFWGRNWDKIPEYVKNDIPSEWIHDYIPYKEANHVYSSADIMLGLQNYTTQVTQRTYEILASRGFLITCDTPGVRSLFEPGKELVVSTSPKETVELVRYYLDRPDKRTEIAKKGQTRVQSESYAARAEYMLKILKKERII